MIICYDSIIRYINCLWFFFRFILHAKKTGFVVEHDFIMATYLADRVIVFEGSPSVNATAHTPQTLLNGMNRFLELLSITFRRDPNNFRPRINKLASVKVNVYFYFFCLILFDYRNTNGCVQICRIWNKNVLDNISS